MKTITQILFFVSCISYAQTFTYIDFGRGTVDDTTLGNWNNANSPASQSVITIADLIDSSGASTGVAFAVQDDVFNNVNTGGTSSPDPGIPFPSTASSDSFFGSTSSFGGITEPTGGFKLTGLNPAYYYSFSVFASRSASDNREARYTVVGSTTKSDDLNPSDNTSNTATINNVQPNGSGEITFTAEPGPNNDNSFGFYYLGAIEMITTSSPLSTDSFKLKAILGLNPNPVDDFLEIKLNLKESSKLKIDLYDISGRLIANVFDGEASGDFEFLWKKTSSKSVISSGLYLLKTKVNNTEQTSKLFFK